LRKVLFVGYEDFRAIFQPFNFLEVNPLLTCGTTKALTLNHG